MILLKVILICSYSRNMQLFTSHQKLLCQLLVNNLNIQTHKIFLLQRKLLLAVKMYLLPNLLT